MNHSLFNIWADTYDESVNRADEENAYPFAGYHLVIRKIYQEINQRPNQTVLDIGFGTATLMSKLYEQNHTIYGLDFSEKMLCIARQKMPKANLYLGDFKNGLLPELQAQKYDVITATYSLHHLNELEKVYLIKSLISLLNDGGIILIGDVAFKTRSEHDLCKMSQQDEWDEEEFYFIFDEFSKGFDHKMTFEVCSMCAGIIRIQK